MDMTMGANRIDLYTLDNADGDYLAHDVHGAGEAALVWLGESSAQAFADAVGATVDGVGNSLLYSADHPASHLVASERESYEAEGRQWPFNSGYGSACDRDELRNLFGCRRSVRKNRGQRGYDHNGGGIRGVVVSVSPLPAYEKLTCLLKPRHKALALSDSVSEKNSY